MGHWLSSLSLPPSKSDNKCIMGRGELARAWSQLRTVPAGLKLWGPAAAVTWLTSGQPGLSHQSCEASHHWLQRPVSTQPRSGSGKFKKRRLQNSFIMKVSKKTFPPDIVIPYKSGIKTKHWFLLLRLNMKTEFLRQSTHYLQQWGSDAETKSFLSTLHNPW